MGRFGLVTDQTLRVAAMVKESGELTNAGIFHTTIISHPTEGFVVCGEEEMAGKVDLDVQLKVMETDLDREDRESRPGRTNSGPGRWSGTS